jgi:ABC-2 type transport system permease protein
MAASSTAPAPPRPGRPPVPPTWRQALRIAGNDLRRRVRDRSLLIMSVLAPIVLGMIVGFAFGGGFSFSATIGVADEDGSRVSRQISQALISEVTSDGVDTGSSASGADAPEVGLELEPVEPDGVRELVEDGTVDAVIVLPAGLGDAVQAGSPVTLGVVGHPGRTLSAAIAQAVADSIAAQIAATRLAVAAAVVSGQQSGQPVDPAQVAADARDLASPLQVQPTDVRSTFSVIGYFAPAMAMLFLFFTLGAGARSVISERNEGTLQRVRAAPVTSGAVLLGKTLAVLVQGLLSVFTIWAVTSLAFGVDWGDPLGVAAVLAAVVVSIAGIALLITGLARTENQADGLTTIIALALAVLGGSFFFGGAGAVAALKPFTPNGRALLALTELSAGEATLFDVLPSVLGLLAVGLLTGAVGLVALRRKVAL